MKTFFVTAVEPVKRHKNITKGVVVAETEDAALEIVRKHYPPMMRGWEIGTRFSAIEIKEGRFFTC